jgi:protocatechuate 4,5-dioxygenase beta chain
MTPFSVAQCQQSLAACLRLDFGHTLRRRTMREGRNMAEIVAAFGVPHTPNFPALVARQGPDCKTASLYAEVARHLHDASPDVLVIYTDDHFNTFFLDNFPTFAIGIADQISGPNDQTAMPSYRVPGEASLASYLRARAVADGFDLSLVQKFDLDHSIMVPLHFLTPDMRIPIVPFFINGLAPPLPSAQRCYALGQAVGAAIEDWPADKRVAVIGSGSFSLEIGGPKIPPGERAGTPDPQWAKRVQDDLEYGRVAGLVAEATASRLARAGNIGGELLNWIAMLGVVGDRKPIFIAPEIEHGHAYAAWRLD